MRIIPDRCVLARLAGEASYKTLLGAEADLIRNIHGVAATAEFDGDELGYSHRESGETQSDVVTRMV